MSEIQELAELLGLSEEQVKANFDTIKAKMSSVSKAQRKAVEESKDAEIEAFHKAVENVVQFAYREFEEINPLPGGQAKFYLTIAENGSFLLAGSSKPKNLQTPIWIDVNCERSTDMPRVKRGYKKGN